MKDPVNIICATNAGYIMPLCVMLASVVDNFDPERDLIVHVISNDADEKLRKNVKDSVRMNRPGMKHSEIHWYSVDLALIRDLPVPSCYLTTETYLRLFAPVLLPKSCKRAIYLDCDLVVTADLSQLYDSTASGKSVLHAVHDISNPFVSSVLGVFDYQERGLPPKTRCMNGGVLVIDLAKWRERDLTAKLVDYLARHGNRVKLGDQGALNGLLHSDWTPLDIRWNQGSFILFPELWTAAGYSLEERLRTTHHPYVVHFAGSKKPWQAGRRAPRYSYFFRYLKRTVYKGSIPRHPILESIIGVRPYYYLWSRLSKFKRWIERYWPNNMELARIE